MKQTTAVSVFLLSFLTIIDLSHGFSTFLSPQHRGVSLSTPSNYPSHIFATPIITSENKMDAPTKSTSNYDPSDEFNSIEGDPLKTIYGENQKMPYSIFASSINESNISKDKLLSCVVHVALHGSQMIRSTAGADVQQVIVSSLLNKYPSLNIVMGDEDIVDSYDDTNIIELNKSLALEFYLPEAMLSEKMNLLPDELDLNDLTVYMNPLDGKMDDENASCLIGICYRGRPIMGVISILSPNEGAQVVYGMIGKGVGKIGMTKDTMSSSLPTIERYSGMDDAFSISSDDSSTVVHAVVDVAQKIFAKNKKIEHQIIKGCGNKLLQVAYGTTTLSLLDHDKTSSCNTAAPTAILSALGGKVTDYFGENLIYDDNNNNNNLGVIASAPGAHKEHRKLAHALCGNKECLSILEQYGIKTNIEEAAQCVDIVRDLNGYLLPVQYFANKMNIENVEAYSCPETEAFRGLMSNACRVHLYPGLQTAFYKRIIFENLDHAQEKLKNTPYKLKTDAKSYNVVISFLTSKAYQALTEKTGVRIPKCYDVNLEPNNDNPIESKFSFLLEDYSPSDGWYQRWLLQDIDECEATLTTLAKVHAFFWSGSSFWKDVDAGEELEGAIWKSASYAQPKRNLGQCKKVAKSWSTERFRCEDDLSSFDYWDDLGERLESIAEEAGQFAHPFAYDDSVSESYQKYRTFSHGDPKQANFLLRRPSDDDNLQVGLIDFQWSGFGLAATDIAHYLTAAVHADRLTDGGEEYLLRYYHGELSKYLIDYGAYANKDDVAQNYSYDTFINQYETAVLDICRLVIAYTWKRWDPVDKDDEEGCERTFNKNSYNKSIPNIVWLMSRCDEIMKSRGV